MANWTIQSLKEAADVADEAMRRHSGLSLSLRIHADSVRVVGRMNGLDYSRIISWTELEGSNFNVLTANVGLVVTRLTAKAARAASLAETTD